MRMNNKSFLFGIFVASFTWGIAIYLYYLISSSEDLKEFKNGHAYNTNQNPQQDPAENEVNNNFIESDRKLISWDSKQYFHEKMARYKKEKQKKKISQKLMDELKPVVVTENWDEFGAIRNMEDQNMRDKGYKTHAFNVLVSNKLGLIREIPDTRHKL